MLSSIPLSVERRGTFERAADLGSVLVVPVQRSTAGDDGVPAVPGDFFGGSYFEQSLCSNITINGAVVSGLS